VIVARARRPGLALTALLLILVITAAWWALALWPLGAAAPEWLVRTRAVCFGTGRTGLPDAGGWILLVGEPIGMIAALLLVWGESLRADLEHAARRVPGRLMIAAIPIALTGGAWAAWARVERAQGAAAAGIFATDAPLPRRTALVPPALALVDQHSRRTTLDDVRGRWAILTFAFGHCETMCPLIVQDVLRARREQAALDVPVYVITLDPWRDTPERLGTLARAWQLGPHDRALSGSIAQVNATLDAWGIPRRRDERTGALDHGSTVVVIDPDGRVAWRIEGSPSRVAAALRRRT